MSASSALDSKRIVKNTLYLYIRMFIMMLVSLYTSRLILDILGITDFGVFNLIAGIIVLFSFISNASRTSILRFLNYEIGKDNQSEIRNIFNVSVITHIFISIIVFFISEFLGRWIFDEYLNIPIERLETAKLIYHLAILNACLQTIQVPYSALVIAYEKMSFFSLASIIECILKLLSVCVLPLFAIDKLFSYSLLLLGISFLILLMYIFYCRKRFPVCKIKHVKDWFLFKRIWEFSLWSLLGNMSNVAMQQVGNIFLNIFYGIIVNAAMGLANQISQAIYSFVSNFQMAFNPQLMKSYAIGDYVFLKKTIIRSTKFSFLLFFLISYPAILNMDYIVYLWLEEIPYYSVSFCRLIILSLLIDSLASPLWIVMQATGKMRKYQLTVSLIILMNLPVSYFLFWIGMPPDSILYVRLFINIILFYVRFKFVSRMALITGKEYIYDVILKIFIVFISSVIFPLIIAFLTDGLLRLFSTSVSFIALFAFATYLWGMTSDEKKYAKKYCLQKSARIFSKKYFK